MIRRGSTSSTANIQASPFLIGRSRTHGYRIVVAPDFLADRTALAALRSATGGDRTGPGTVRAREITGLAGGSVTVVYRVVTPSMEELGLGRHGDLEDQRARPILLVEGFAMKAGGQQPTNTAVTVGDLRRVRQLTAPVFREFWALEDDFRLRTMQPFDRHPRTAGNPALAVIRIEPWVPPRLDGDSAAARSAPYRPGRVGVLLTASTAAAVIAGFWLAGPESRRPPSLTPQPTSAAAITKVVCGFLTSGDLSSAYHLTTAEFQKAVTLTAFAHAVSGQPAPELRAGSASCGTAQPDAAVLPTSPATPEASRTPTEGDTTALATAYLPAANSPQWTSRITLRKQLDSSWRITGVCGDQSRSAGTTPTNSGMVASEETCVG